MFDNPQRNWRILLTAVALILILSFGGTIGALYFLSATPSGERLRNSLGLSNLKTFTIENTQTQKLVVEESSAIIDANKKVQPAVVSITSTNHAVRDIFGFGTIQAPQTAGTGFIVTNDGLIVTNKHVISGGDSYTVTSTDGKSYDGKVVAQDPTNDLAIVKIDARGLPVVDLGDSDQVQVGQWVIAIGNALGELQNTVTVGVISAKERTAEPSDGNGTTESLAGLLQTDAAINPGNSGGPLLNLAGQVIGINTAIAGNAQNIGFAIPVADIKADLQSYQKNGKIIEPYIGVQYQAITKALATSLGLPVEKGALLTGNNGQSPIVAGSPAEAAGLKDGDIITKINNDQITETVPLTRLIRKYNPGDKVSLTILRDKKEQKVDLTLGRLGN